MQGSNQRQGQCHKRLERALPETRRALPALMPWAEASFADAAKGVGRGKKLVSLAVLASFVNRPRLDLRGGLVDGGPELDIIGGHAKLRKLLDDVGWWAVEHACVCLLQHGDVVVRVAHRDGPEV